MTRPLGANRLLHIFGGEILNCEDSISEGFVLLTRYVHFERPPAAPIHKFVKRILIESGAISLVLFPSPNSPKTSKDRALFLCSEFSVAETSILKDRALRNDLAHLDERLDNWAMSSQNKTFGRGMLGSRADAAKIGLNSDDILGLFDTQRLVYSFRKNDVSIDELVGEVRSIAHSIRRKLKDLPWSEEAH